MNRYLQLARGVSGALAPIAGGLVICGIIIVVWVNVTASRPGGQTPTKDLGPAIEEIQRHNSDVYDIRVEDSLLMIQVGGDWSDAGATSLACETVKPILQAHGFGGQQFAIYDRKGAVIATGRRC